MSLRVLLADESDTIKKVFQLALQDLNAEIKSVHSGLDVIDVAQSFKPDIIFADVLLQKKNGYDTCHEIKQNPNLGTTPVVLMWSSFMELDQEQLKKSKTDDQLEKPFDADFLRSLIKKHVASVSANPLDRFLSFPKSISAGLTRSPNTNTGLKSLKESSVKEESSEFNFGAVSQVSKITPAPTAPEVPMDVQNMDAGQDTSKDDSWLSADLSKFKIEADAGPDNLDKFEALNLGKSMSGISTPAADFDDEKTDDISVETSPEDLQSPTTTTNPTSTATASQVRDKSAAASTLDSILEPEVNPFSVSTRSHTGTATRGPQTDTGSKNKVVTNGMSAHEIEAIVRAHTEEVIKAQITDSLLVIIEKIVRDELSKILDEEVRLKQDLSGDNP